MLAALALAAQLQRDTLIDAPVFDDARFGVAIPRPFDDWVFAASAARGTTTVIFHPRRGSLSDQVWGVLVLTRLDGPTPLADLAERRLRTAWRAQLGSTYTLIARDSVDLVGLPAVRLLVSGAIDHAVLEVEEYLVVRDTDLVLLQFRYPRHVSRDSLEAGYRRTLDGIDIRGGSAPPRPPPAPPARGAAANEASARWDALRESPWTVEEVDVAVRAETPRGSRAAAARLDLVNDGPVPAGSVTLWVPSGAAVDSVRVGPRRAGVTGRGQGRRVTLEREIMPGSNVSVTVYYRWTGEPEYWLPLAQSPTDSAGEPRRIGLPRVAVRANVPDSLRAVSTGHLSAEAAHGARRLLTWNAQDVPAPALVITARRRVTLRRGRLLVHLWRVPGGLPADTTAPQPIATEVYRLWRALWRAFGPVPLAEVHLVEAAADSTRGYPGLVLLGGDAAAPGVLARELARTWWGGEVRVDGAGARRFINGLLLWTASRIAITDTSEPELLAGVRAVVGDARLRETLRTIAADARGGWITMDDVFAALGAQGAAALRAGLR